MADASGELEWYLPEVRTIIPLDSYNFPRSLKKFMSTATFEYSFDSDYLSVIHSCASRDVTWISDKLINAYKGLYKAGYLHSVEVRESGQLVGGLYGVSYKGAFFGESMFSRVSQASKAALIKLIEHLNSRGFILLDVQYQTPHLKMFGTREISFEEFSELLQKASRVNCTF